MIWTLAYFLVAAGCNDAGMPYWRAMFWPVTAGKLLARVTGTQMSKRSIEPSWHGGTVQPITSKPSTPPPPKPKG